MEVVMPEAVHNAEHEYWRPPAQSGRVVDAPPGRHGQLTCSRCGTEFIMGARFCHVCGSEREGLAGARRWAQILDFTGIRESLGLSLGALIAFIAGLGCILAAIGTGLVYTAATALDWQAVQIWRIEWLIAGAAAFLAGILLKKPDGR